MEITKEKLHWPASKVVHLDQKLLQETRKIAERAVDQGLAKKEDSIRPLWEIWEKEINILRLELSPLLAKIFEPPSSYR